jgi:hypothetical protein
LQFLGFVRKFSSILFTILKSFILKKFKWFCRRHFIIKKVKVHDLKLSCWWNVNNFVNYEMILYNMILYILGLSRVPEKTENRGTICSVRFWFCFSGFRFGSDLCNVYILLYHMILYDIQVTLDGSNFDLWKWNHGPYFFLYTTKQINSWPLKLQSLEVLDLSKCTHGRSSVLAPRGLYLDGWVNAWGLAW